jgi:hypothetical protein
VLTSYPSVWILLALPFISSAVIASVPSLRKLTTTHNHSTWPAGLVGLLLLVAGLVGVLPAALGLPLMLLGGVVGGFAMFRTRPDSDDDDDWRRWGEPPDDPPPLDGPIDWQRFDRLRRQWERRPLARR